MYHIAKRMTAALLAIMTLQLTGAALSAQDSQVGVLDETDGLIYRLCVVVETEQPAAHFFWQLGDHFKDVLATFFVRFFETL